MPRPLRIAAYALAGLTLVPLALLGVLTLTEWWPPKDVAQAVVGGAPGPLPTRLTLLTWNIGYAAMDRQTDFFMDGGRMSLGRSGSAVRANLAAIGALLRTRAPDVVILQEVDERARRSHGVGERASLERVLGDYAHTFTPNYRVPYVPVPLGHAMGGVRSGLLTLSRVTPLEARGLRLPGRQSWPNRLFNLKRAVTVVRLAVVGGRELVLVHVHLTAFDSVGNLRPLEEAFVRARVLREAEAGRYVIVGGDWNSELPGPGKPPCAPGMDDRSWLIDMPADFAPPGWTWAVGGNAPTVRTLGAPLSERTTCYAHIDGFLLSPGVELLRAQTLDLGFENSDHNPVEIEVALH